MLGHGLVAGAAYAAWRAWQTRVPQPATDVEWEPAPFPFPPTPRVRAAGRDTGHDAGGDHVHVPESVTPGGGPEVDGIVTGVEPWMEPLDGTCPASHPVKAKLSSGIFHVPGGANYDRTVPDRCYVDGAAAEADGLRRAKH
jgi:hypothetical protein